MKFGNAGLAVRGCRLKQKDNKHWGLSWSFSIPLSVVCSDRAWLRYIELQYKC